MPTSSPRRRPLTTYVHRNRRVRIPDGHLAVGYIVGAHGLRGEVRVELYTDFPDRFVPGLRLLLGEELEPLDLQQARPHQSQLLLLFDGIESREAAEELRGLWLFIPDAEAAALEPDTYFVHDIIGLQVVTDEGRTLGKVTDILFTGANEVYVVEDAAGNQVLLPAIAHVVRTVDLAARRITVTLLPGLLDE
jgi:16S rRNA processing protein RimM